MQHIVVRDPDPGSPYGYGRHIVSGKDYYWHDGVDWWGGDLFGLFDYLSQPGLKTVKFGRAMENSAWRKLYQRVLRDPEFATKSAYLPGEYNPKKAARQDED